jgi:lipoate-protein ligase B
LAPRYILHRHGIVGYQAAWALQRRVAAQVRDGDEPHLILLEHPPTYTLGVRGKQEHFLLSQETYLARGAEVHRTDRGGDVTYHGPGQLVGYPIMRLREHGPGPVWYVRSLESMLIEVLARFGIVASRSERNPGVWVGGAKIAPTKVAAIGVRVAGGVTTHGFALNVNTDLSYFDDIVPCGLPGVRVTSMQALTGETLDIDAVADEVVASFERQFRVERAPAPAMEVAVGR